MASRVRASRVLCGSTSLQGRRCCGGRGGMRRGLRRQGGGGGGRRRSERCTHRLGLLRAHWSLPARDLHRSGHRLIRSDRAFPPSNRGVAGVRGRERRTCEHPQSIISLFWRDTTEQRDVMEAHRRTDAVRPLPHPLRRRIVSWRPRVELHPVLNGLPKVPLQAVAKARVRLLVHRSEFAAARRHARRLRRRSDRHDKARAAAIMRSRAALAHPHPLMRAATDEEWRQVLGPHPRIIIAVKEPRAIR